MEFNPKFEQKIALRGGGNFNSDKTLEQALGRFLGQGASAVTNLRAETFSYRGYRARLTAAPLVNKGFYFCQGLVFAPGREEQGEVVSGRGMSPESARRDCIRRVKAKIDGWLDPE